MMMQTLGLEDLIRLVDDLRLAGYDIGTQQYIDVQRLLVALAAHGRHPPRLLDLPSLLAPVLCSSPKEQEKFYLYFSQWLARQPHLAQAADDVRADGPIVPPPKRLWRRPLFYAPLAAAVLLVGTFALLRLVSLPAVSISGVVVAQEDGSPVPGASVALRGPAGAPLPTPAVTGPDGRFTFSYSAREAPVGVDVNREGFEGASKLFDAQGSQQPLTVVLRRPPATPGPAAPEGGNVAAGGQESPGLQPTATPTPPPEVVYAPAAGRLLETSLIFLPLVLFAVWWLWRFYSPRRMLLRKGRSIRPPCLEQLTVRGAAEQLFQGQAFRRIVQELRRHRLRGSRDLDEQDTVEATIRRGGLFTPSYSSRKTLPEYLVLIERLSVNDQQARFHEEVVRRLIQDNIIADVYHFRGDPRICRRVDERALRPGTHLTLSDLAALHPDYYLLIFSDGAAFIDPITGTPKKWLDKFSPWASRAILMPGASVNWSRREWVLRESDFLVLPGGKEGLEALSQTIGVGAPPAYDPGRGGHPNPFPKILREQTYRWLEDHEPPPAKVGHLFEQLEAYLGADGLNWLAACAVYPALQWDVTLYLGRELFSDREEFERKLPLLVSLPWLRHGVMPDWLRVRLVVALPPTAERAVRLALEKLLLSAVDALPGDVWLGYSMRQEEARPSGLNAAWVKLWWWLNARKRRRMLHDLFRAEGAESPLYDFVFLTFMSGRHPRRLDLDVPELLRRIFFPHGLEAFGLRRAAAFACAVLLSLATWAATRALRPGPRPSTSTKAYAESYTLKPSRLTLSADRQPTARFEFSIEKHGADDSPAGFPGLKAGDLSVTLDGHPIPIAAEDLSRMDRENTGILFMVDGSGSMRRRLRDVQYIVRNAIANAESDETMAVGVFAEDIRWIAEPTTNKSRLIDTVADYGIDAPLSNYTRLYDAVEAAVRKANEWKLRTVVLITDGLENSSDLRSLGGSRLADFKIKKEKGIAELLRATGARVVAVLLEDIGSPGPEPSEMGTLVDLREGPLGDQVTYLRISSYLREFDNRTLRLERSFHFTSYKYALDIRLGEGARPDDTTHQLRIITSVGTAQRAQLPIEYQYRWGSGSDAPFVYPNPNSASLFIEPKPPPTGLDGLAGIYLLMLAVLGGIALFPTTTALVRELTSGALASPDQTLSERVRDALRREGGGRKKLRFRRAHLWAALGLTALMLAACFGSFVVWKYLREEVRLRSQERGVMVYIPATIPQGMAYVPGGEFRMGRDDGEVYERPAHATSVKPFLIDLYEVTCEQYQRFIRSTGHRAPPGWVGADYPLGSARLPVTGVDWDDASSFARWAGKRLPTEAEWEYVARGTDGRLYPWGDTWRDSLANADGARNGLAEVGSNKGVSPFGAYDMVGNAWEWTTTDLSPYPGGQLPLTSSANLKIIRGGSFAEDRTQATATYRGYLDANSPNNDKTGFRCVQDIMK